MLQSRDAARKAFLTLEGPQSALSDEIKDAELILTAFRTLLLLALAVAPLVSDLSKAYSREVILLLIIAGIYNIIIGIVCLSPERFIVRRPVILAMDTTLISAWIHFSGRFELISFYYVTVIVAAMWYRVFGGILAAGVCNILFFYLWSRITGDNSQLRPLTAHSTVWVNPTLLFVIGILAGYISEAQEKERLRRMERELLIASYQNEIDISGELQPLLLKRFAQQPRGDIEIGAAIQSARSAGGGDYLDVITLPNGQTLLCIADVSGKSVRAQARVPLLKYSLRALAPLHPEPAELMERLQSTLLEDLAPELYIALCLVVLDSEKSTLCYCNAGHIPPFFVRGTKVSRLETTCPALGLFPEITPQSRKWSWTRGDAILLFTDGLADALSVGAPFSGEDQVEKIVPKIAVFEEGNSANEMAQELVDMASAAQREQPFTPRLFGLIDIKKGKAVQWDDVAVLIARFL